MMNLNEIRESKQYKEMEPYTACSIAEGFCDFEPTIEQVQAAWQYLHDTKLAYKLQGWYGRSATSLIESGRINP